MKIDESNPKICYSTKKYKQKKMSRNLSKKKKTAKCVSLITFNVLQHISLLILQWKYKAFMVAQHDRQVPLNNAGWGKRIREKQKRNKEKRVQNGQAKYKTEPIRTFAYLLLSYLFKSFLNHISL